MQLPRIRDDETCWCGVPLDHHDDIRLICRASPHPADCWPPAQVEPGCQPQGSVALASS
jgi:hypothetical protein